MNIWSHPNSELIKIMEIVLRTKRRVFVEIGCFNFNMTSIFALLSERNPLIIANDIKDHFPKKRELLSDLLGNSFQFVLGDSKRLKIISEIGFNLLMDKADILYIDGDHAAESTESDFKNYMNMVSPDGYIIIHDVSGFEVSSDDVNVVHERKIRPWFIGKLNQNVRLNFYFEGNAKLAYIKRSDLDV